MEQAFIGADFTQVLTSHLYILFFVKLYPLHWRLARWRRWSAERVGACLILQPYITSPTSKLILQPLRRFTYVTTHSTTLPLLHLCHSSFSNPSFASPTSQALHLIHLASRPWLKCLYRERLGSPSIYYRRRQVHCVTWWQQRYAEVQSC